MTIIEKREMIVQAKAEGMKIEEIVPVYHVDRSIVYDLLALVEETGDIQPRPHEYGRNPSLDVRKMTELRALLDKRWDIMLAVISNAFAAVTVSDISGWFVACGYSG